MDLVVYDDDERRYVPWLVSVAAVVLTAVLAAALTFLFTRSSGAEEVGGLAAPQAATASVAPSASPTQPEPSPSAEPSPAQDEPEVVVTLSPPAAEPSPAPAPAGEPTRPPACATALVQADAALTRASAIEQALAEQTRIMDELLAQRITDDQALDRSLPVLTRGAAHRDVYVDELAAYEQSRADCPG